MDRATTFSPSQQDNPGSEITSDHPSADIKIENGSSAASRPQEEPAKAKGGASRSKQRSRRKPEVNADSDEDSAKRRCVSTACIACRKRKSKCDGNLPACAACSRVYNTECIYDPNSDHRRKGVYKTEFDSLKTRTSTLQTLIQAILNYSEDEIPALVREIRTCDSLDAVAESIAAKERGSDGAESTLESVSGPAVAAPRTFEQSFYSKLGDLRLDDGSVRYLGGTSNFIHLAQDAEESEADEYDQQESPITSWTEVTDDSELVIHLLNMYFTWHYTFFTTLSKTLFYRDFLLGRPPAHAKRRTHYCTPLLVNAILALGCHFTAHVGAREDPSDSATAGDHFFREAKRLVMADDNHERPRLATVQALALMSVREAGCGREASGWVYSGMSFRMACDMGLNLDSGRLTANKHINGDEAEEDVRRITFWGCYLFDKCWSNYLGRLPQLSAAITTVPKIEVFPDEDASQWTPYTDSGASQSHAQPARTRAVALQITKLCEISDDLMRYFYNPSDLEKTKGKAAELKKLSDIHTRLEAWRRDLPKEMEPREGGLSSVLVMHMFFQLLFIHLFRPFLKYTQATSPLPSTVSPRKLCTQAAAMISKLMRLYKRSYGLRQICNIAVYIAHSACTIHLLNLPDKNAKRDITHGLKHLEEIAEGWLCARRTLGLLSVLARKWNVQLPDEAAAVLARTDVKFASYVTEVNTPSTSRRTPEHGGSPFPLAASQMWQVAGVPPGGPGVQTSSPVPSLHDGAPSLRTIPISSHQSPNPLVTSATLDMFQGRPMDQLKDRFGGVEQLLRDSQNWVYRDQAQYATGFGNWNTNIDIDPSASWSVSAANHAASTASGRKMNHNAIPHPTTIPPASASGITMPTTMHQATPISPSGPMNANMHVAATGVPTSPFQGAFVGPSSNLDTYNTKAWMNAMGDMSIYNENEWYQ